MEYLFRLLIVILMHKNVTITNNIPNKTSINISKERYDLSPPELDKHHKEGHKYYYNIIVY